MKPSTQEIDKSIETLKKAGFFQMNALWSFQDIEMKADEMGIVFNDLESVKQNSHNVFDGTQAIEWEDIESFIQTQVKLGYAYEITEP